VLKVLLNLKPTNLPTDATCKYPSKHLTKRQSTRSLIEWQRSTQTVEERERWFAVWIQHRGTRCFVSCRAVSLYCSLQVAWQTRRNLYQPITRCNRYSKRFAWYCGAKGQQSRCWSPVSRQQLTVFSSRPTVTFPSTGNCQYQVSHRPQTPTPVSPPVELLYAHAISASLYTQGNYIQTRCHEYSTCPLQPSRPRLWHLKSRPVNMNMSALALSLAPVKSRLVLQFWYRLTRVVPDKGSLNGCVCVCVAHNRYS